MKSNSLKLFVWDEDAGIYCDYTSGMAFAIAHDVKEAQHLVQKYMHNITTDEEFTKLEIDSHYPPAKSVQIFELDSPRAFGVYGGG